MAAPTTKRTFWRELVLGIAIAIAGTAGTAVSVGSVSRTAQCQQATDLLVDDQLNGSLAHTYRHSVLATAAARARACLKD